MATDRQAGPDKARIDGLIALYAQGRLGDALREAAALIARFPDAPVLHNIQGAVQAALGQHAQAVRSYRTALRLKKTYVEALNNLATALNDMGRHADAAASARKALRLRPDYAEAHNALGNALAGLDRPGDAAASYGEALRHKPDHADAHYNLGVVLAGLGRPADAIESYRRSLALRPDHAETLNNLGNALAAIERADEAIASYERALALRPDYAEAHNNLGNVLNDLGRHDDAIACYTRALAINPSPSAAQYAFNLGLALKARGDFSAALAAYDEALALAPALPDLAYNRALAAMTLGRFEDGLPGYETRWSIAEPTTAPRTFAVRRWTGGPLADGESLLVWAEQGVGDHLLYGALLAETERRAGRVVFECDPRLRDLFARAFPRARVIAAEADPGGGIGAEIPMGSLMAALAPWPDGFVAPSRYIEPDPERRAARAASLAVFGDRPRIGIAWRSARRKVGPKKSIPLDQWGPILADRDAVFVNLQYGETDEETAQAEAAFGCTLFTDPAIDRFDDLDGLAALIDSLDAVVSTSNVTAHLAGALGKPCHLMVQRAPIWYWGHAGERTAFYPSVLVHRQARPPFWDDVVADVAAALSRRLDPGGGRRGRR